MNTGRARRVGVCWIAATGVVSLVVLSAVATNRAAAHAILASADANQRWHAPAKSNVATFLGKDEKETAVLVVKKSAVLDTTITIESDASAVHLLSGENIRITFSLP